MKVKIKSIWPTSGRERRYNGVDLYQAFWEEWEFKATNLDKVDPPSHKCFSFSVPECNIICALRTDCAHLGGGSWMLIPETEEEAQWVQSSKV